MATVNGEWYFEKYLNFPSDIFDNAIMVNFEVVNNDWRDSLNIVGFVYDKINEDKNTLCYLTQDSSDGGIGYYKVYTKGESWLSAVNYDYRHIDFGSAEQEVSDIFYAWLLENATPVPDSDASQTIWTDYCILKATGGIHTGFLVPEDQVIIQEVSGTIKRDIRFTKIKCGVTQITDMGNKTLELIFSTNEGVQYSIFQGYSDKQEPFDGGPIFLKFDANQQISQAFYNWLTENTIIYNTNTSLVGVWQFGTNFTPPMGSLDTEYSISIQDNKGVLYTKWKYTSTDMGDIEYQFYRPDTNTWVTAFTMSF